MSTPQTTRQYCIAGADGSRSLALQETQVEKPKSNEVLLRVHAVSLNYRDIAIVQNNYPRPIKDNLVPASDCAAEIIALGSDVKDWVVGDRVCINFHTAHLSGKFEPRIMYSGLGGQSDGVLTEYRNAPAEALVRIPEYLSWEEAATLPCAAVTAYNSLMGPVPLKGGDIVLILGTGGVSIFGLQIAVASGATVIVTSSSDKKLKIAKKLGAHHLINYSTTPDWHEEVLRLTNGYGADHVLEVGGAGTLPKSLQAVAFEGWVHSIGFLAGASHDLDSIGRSVNGRLCQLRGIGVGPVSKFKDLNRLLSVSQIHPIVNKIFVFEETQKAYEYLAAQGHVGKVVIRINGKK